MRISRKDDSETLITLTVSASADDLLPIRKKVVQRLGQSVKVSGFRAGHAPQNLVEKQLNPNVLQSEVVEEALSAFYAAAAKEHRLRPVSHPQVSVTKFVPFSELVFEAKVSVVGSISLPDYTKIKKTKPTVAVTDKEVESVVASLKTRLADKIDVVRSAQAGDQLWIDFKGQDEKGQPVNGAEGQDFPLLLGSDTFIPGFEKNLVGLKAGKEKTFSLTFPKDYNVTAIAGKKVTFKVSVKKVQEVVEPKVDDAFATKAGPFKSVAELKADIKKQLTFEKQQQADRQFENELISEIAAKSRAAVPEILIEQQIDRLEQTERQNLTYRGQTWEEHLKAEGVTAAKHRSQKRRVAEQQVKNGLILSEIADKESLDVTPEELEIRLRILKGQYQDKAMQAELDKEANRRDIALRLLTEKTIHKLVGYATKN